MYRRSAAVVEIKVDHRNSAVFTFYIAVVEMNDGRDERTPNDNPAWPQKCRKKGIFCYSTFFITLQKKEIHENKIKK